MNLINEMKILKEFELFNYILSLRVINFELKKMGSPTFSGTCWWILVHAKLGK